AASAERILESSMPQRLIFAARQTLGSLRPLSRTELSLAPFQYSSSTILLLRLPWDLDFVRLVREPAFFAAISSPLCSAPPVPVISVRRAKRPGAERCLPRTDDTSRAIP